MSAPKDVTEKYLADRSKTQSPPPPPLSPVKDMPDIPPLNLDESTSVSLAYHGEAVPSNARYKPSKPPVTPLFSNGQKTFDFDFAKEAAKPPKPKVINVKSNK